jgi:TnpA family transposase
LYPDDFRRGLVLQHEIESGLNVVEGWNGVNDILFGKSGELTSNQVDQQPWRSSPST